MTTFEAGFPLACFCYLNMSISWVSSACILLTSVSSLLGSVRCLSIMCSMLLTLFLSHHFFYPINELRGDAKVSSVCRLLRVTPSSQALKVI